MMARSESWLSVTSSAGVGSYTYSYYQRKRTNSRENKAIDWTNPIRVGAESQHKRSANPSFVSCSARLSQGQSHQAAFSEGFLPRFHAESHSAILSNKTGSTIKSKALMVSTARRITGSETG